MRALATEYLTIMNEWAEDIPSAGLPLWPWPHICAAIVREHSHTDPGTGVTKEDYITRELHKEGMTA